MKHSKQPPATMENKLDDLNHVLKEILKEVRALNTSNKAEAVDDWQPNMKKIKKQAERDFYKFNAKLKKENAK